MRIKFIKLVLFRNLKKKRNKNEIKIYSKLVKMSNQNDDDDYY